LEASDRNWRGRGRHGVIPTDGRSAMQRLRVELASHCPGSPSSLGSEKATREFRSRSCIVGGRVAMAGENEFDPTRTESGGRRRGVAGQWRELAAYDAFDRLARRELRRDVVADALRRLEIAREVIRRRACRVEAQQIQPQR